MFECDFVKSKQFNFRESQEKQKD